MGVLHMAVNMQRNDLVDLILLSELSNIDLVSPIHGSPLHMACKQGNTKLVQQLLINGADINIRFKGKLAKDCTDNQRISFLIEKYEILKAKDGGESSDDMNSDFDPTPQKESNLSGFVHKI